MKIELESEPYGPSGNIAAEGVLSLLGRPTTDQLNTCIRESIQNAWDARSGTATPKCSIRVRRLEGAEFLTMRDGFFTELPDEPDCPLQEIYERDSLTVLEIADFGTSGLGGPTDPSKVTDNTRATDFVDFFRNLGSPRDTSQGGGTYGYGKSSLYAISQYQTIVVDTRTHDEGTSVHRVMACRIGRNYFSGTGRKRCQFTGRHWWGKSDRKGYVQPITGRNAERISDELGLPSRQRRLGTTITILEPMLPDVDPATLSLMLRDSILWNFWPKLVEQDNGKLPLEFSLEVFGKQIPIPSPDSFPPLHLFADALRDVRARDASCTVVSSQRPAARLGHLKISKFPKIDRVERLEGEDQIIPDDCHHVALMRPAELVVKYLEGNPLVDASQEWAGVFVCSDDDEVEAAFAKSEPPAHDDWVPSYLPSRSKERTMVNVALKRVREEMRQYGAPVDKALVDSDIPMARIADVLGSILTTGPGDRAGPPNSPSPKTKSAKRRKIQISKPKAGKLRHEGGELVGEFTATVSAAEEHKVRIIAHPSVVFEGNSVGDTAPNGRSPQIIRWKKGGRVIEEHSSSIELDVSDEHELTIDVTFPDFVAVKLSVRLEEINGTD